MSEVVSVEVFAGTDRQDVGAAHPGELGAADLPEVGAELSEKHVFQTELKLRARELGPSNGVVADDATAAFDVLQADVEGLRIDRTGVNALALDRGNRA